MEYEVGMPQIQTPCRVMVQKLSVPSVWNCSHTIVGGGGVGRCAQCVKGLSTPIGFGANLRCAFLACSLPAVCMSLKVALLLGGGCPLLRSAIFCAGGLG